MIDKTFNVDQLMTMNISNDDAFIRYGKTNDGLLIIKNDGGWIVKGAFDTFDIYDILEILDVCRFDAESIRIIDILSNIEVPDTNELVIDDKDVNNDEKGIFDCKVGGTSIMSMMLSGTEIFKSDRIKVIEDGNYLLFVCGERKHLEHDLHISGQVISKDFMQVAGQNYCFVITYSSCKMAWTNSYSHHTDSSKGEYRMYGSGNDVDVRHYTITRKDILWKR